MSLVLQSCTVPICVGTQNNTTDKSKTEIDQGKAISPTVILNNKTKPKNEGGENITMDFGIYGNLAGVLKMVLIHICIAGLLIGLLTYFLPSYLLPLRLLPKMLMGFLSAGLLLGIRFAISWIWTMKTGEVVTDLVLGTILANWFVKAFVKRALFTDK